MASVGILFLIPQFFYEKSIGLELNLTKHFNSFIVVFPAITAYYCWQKGVQIIGPNRSTMFVQLMLYSAQSWRSSSLKKNLNCTIFGALFIIENHLSNKNYMIKIGVLDDYQNILKI